MTIQSYIAAIAVAFSVVLFFAPAAHAKDQPSTENEAPKPVIVIVQPGDNLSAIADAHNTTYVRLFNANDFIVNPDIINPGDEIRIPEPDEELSDRIAEPVAVVNYSGTPQSTYIQPTQHSPTTQSYASSSTGNSYYRGYCTWYAKERRPDLPNRLGNGGQWVANAAARGIATGSTPRVGAIAESPGHVAYVESVNGDGSVTISEMNGPAGFGVVGKRTVPANQFRYIY